MRLETPEKTQGKEEVHKEKNEQERRKNTDQLILFTSMSFHRGGNSVTTWWNYTNSLGLIQKIKT